MSEKEQFRGTNSSIEISHLSFHVSNANVIRRQSHLQCINNTLYDVSGPAVKSRRPASYGVLDSRLGTSRRDVKCETCHESLLDCIGHFGYVDLELPVFHPGYFRFVLSILQTICKKCSRFLMSNEKDNLLMRLRRPDLSYLEKKALHKEIVTKSKKLKNCLDCGHVNGTVKKVGLYKILHVFPVTKSTKPVDKGELSELVLLLQSTGENPDLLDILINNRAKGELLDPIRVRKMFEQIPDEELILHLISNFRPEDMIVTRVSVPPACIRPSVMNELDQSTEDDLTIKLSEIIFVNDVIAKRKATGAQMSMLVDDWDFLQLHLALYINSDVINRVPFSMRPAKPTRGLVQRLKGKHGRFRGNLSGKRVDFSSRSVISPNPNLQIDEVGVPEHIAKLLTFPEIVNPANIELMRKLVVNGVDKYPGANFIQEENGNRVFLKYGSRIVVARNLKNGDIVERHLANGDKVLFNRQPSLHKMSIMCHTAKVHSHRTLQFNECVCTPYNADFDGDEMNLHLPQTLEARAEAAVLMGVKNNIITPRNGEPLVAAIQDFITGSFLMTHKDTFFDRGQAMQIISYILAGEERETFIDLPHPCILKPRVLWSGKQIFSLVLVPNKASRRGLCLVTKTKNYSKEREGKPNWNDLCPEDGYVIISNGELISGTVDKTVLGSGSKNNIFYVMLRDINADSAAKAMWRLARVTSFFLSNRGFSLGIDDVTPTPMLLNKKAKLLEDGYTTVLEYIRRQENGQLEAQPGQTSEQTLEFMILKELSGIRDVAGKTCVQELGAKNAPLIMAMCGSKGSLINVSQMVACVGQQAIRNQRVPDGFGDRSLPYFDHRDKTPLAKGFVENSFYSGLTATEFFFHTMAGREGLLDTAVKTAETGYMQRRLMKALEDLVSHYDGSVRNSRGEVIQFMYGDDYLDPVNMEDNNRPVNFQRLLNHVRSIYPCHGEDTIEPSLMVVVADQVMNQQWTEKVSEGFKQDILDFLMKKRDSLLRYFENYPYFMSNEAVKSIERITTTQLGIFLERALDKYLKAILEPGTAVGAICAQSIGEPATQMTLKTFHFAGVASMNITQGIPRIKELINANKTISTPIIRAALMNPHDSDEARTVKMRLEKTTLGQVCQFMDQVVLPDDCFVLIQLYLERIKLLKLEVNEESVCESIARQLKIFGSRLEICGDGQIVVRPNRPHELWQLRESLSSVVVRGHKNIKRAAIRVDDDGKHYLMIEGEGLRDVMATYGVDPCHTCSNNVLEVASCLGVEAARTIIIREIRETMSGHGISIDERHLKLLADTMTYRGEVLGITRFGLAKMKESALMLASFEKTADHLFDAAYFNQSDAIVGVSEAIISGVPMKLGTGFFSLIHKPSDQVSLSKRATLFQEVK